ncbi:LysR family transcriptional regulator [Luteimicrobium subarcticum]|uniref:DNA-binding transcriptional LysR family regulator n=1 Tax=Luteimicrobium subarcticum TaxID=620910 RepID=A0A2M8WR86_9MICO|nr:LysR family transcriptional regulator [Luteimicrobium subarcticum]PJI93428.1 DNA-binding transcriptional LysR family regulator [Luteimicrobium subarcticum]
MDALSLRIFLSLADTENTRDTAAILGVGQPAVSRTLARLERSVGMELFVRHGRRLRLNAQGAAFRPDAAAVLDALHRAERHAEALATRTETVRIAFLHSVARWLVPQSVRAFRAVHPTARVSLRQGFGRDIYGWLAEGTVDIVLGTPPPAGRDATWVPLATEQLCVAVPSGDPLADRDAVRVDVVDGRDFIAFSRITELHVVVRALLDAAGAKPVVMFESSEIDTMRGLVAGGLGVSVLPRPTHVVEPGLAYVPIEPPVHRRLGLGWNETAKPSAAVRAFVDATVGALAGASTGADVPG